MSKFLSFALALHMIIFQLIQLPLSLTAQTPSPASDSALTPQITAAAAILMEASTGEILYEKDSNKQLAPASITKIMTLLLIFDALSQQKISLKDEVSISAHAASMGGSQVYLEENEIQTVDTLINCISISSANDAFVGMAEYLCGSEEAFVASMNQKAKELGMKHTHFVNCCGLDTNDHYTSAKDVALMTRELITKYPQIHDYCTVWMDTITHKTKKGSFEFGLTNTNKLLRQYSYATGLKTGYTSQAKFCLSATAKKDNLECIAVILGAPSPKERFSEATALLNYGFSTCTLYQDTPPAITEKIPISRGDQSFIEIEEPATFSHLFTTPVDITSITKEMNLPDSLYAPIKKGEKIGSILYKLGNDTLGSLSLYSKHTVHTASFSYLIRHAIRHYFTTAPVTTTAK